ncbi:MAG: exodeoxyribonuclease VII large subunit [Endozoicomonadaceae bacterium]|nr:exodeoxyribonuclease VII large subunit [Endozoicomonadaceae bacterium]
MPPSSKSIHILSVNAFIQSAKGLLETSFSHVWISGEISNLTQHTSGHWYFHLKDQQAQIRCAMFKGQNRHVNFEPKHGQQIIIRAKATLYSAKGDFQLLVQTMEPAGEGALQQAFDQLKKKLLAEGLFEAQYKKKLPTFPKNLAVITSPSGAVIQDICSVLKRRCPFIQITILPANVQGKEAISDLLKQFTLVHQMPHHFDALIIARGGGSLEDLQAFNDEKIARAIAACPIPIISSIGHETDTTIADLVADYRAATPSVAAEIISLNQLDWMKTLQTYQHQLKQCMKYKYQKVQSIFDILYKSLPRPMDMLRERTQQLDHFTLQLTHGYYQQLALYREKIQMRTHQLQKLTPVHTLQQSHLMLKHTIQSLLRTTDHLLPQYQQTLTNYTQRLQDYNPLNILKRGYSVLQNEQKKIISSHNQVKINQTIAIQVADGSLSAKIINIQTNESVGYRWRDHSNGSRSL